MNPIAKDALEYGNILNKTSQIIEITRTFGSLQVAPQSPSGGASWIRFEGGNALVMAIHRANS